MPTRPHRVYSTGDFLVDLDRGCILRAGQELRLRPQSFQVLVFLVERHGRLVRKEDLFRAVWPDTFVSDDSLNKCITEIRKALADDRHRIVKTVARRGYIFDGAVESRGFDVTPSPGVDHALYRLERGGPEESSVAHGAVLPFARRRNDNLPEALTSFIGREREVADVRTLLGEHRFVTLTGPGGCGKTRLALEAAGRMRALFRDGVWLTDLAPLNEGVADAVAASLGLRPDGAKPMLQRLSEFLGSRSVLLVIDNCEHLLAECAVLAAAVLRSSGTVHVLATSRESIGIDGERAWPVPGLALAAPGAAPDQILAADAVRLYISRASTVQPQLVLTNDRVRVLNDVCTRLDGIPLAIELAAARGKILTIEQIASRLDDRFRLLLGGDRRLPRQQTLQATVDWSYEQLGEPERRLFRRLSIFPGTWSLDAATNVCTDTRDEFETIDLLARLVEKSLVLIGEDAVEGRRYRMLETIRQYGDSRLRESGEREDMRARHAEYYRQLARSARAALLGPQQPAWLGRLRREHDNFRVALAWSTATADRVVAGLELAASLHLFWFMHGHFNEARRWLSAILAHPAPPTREVERLSAHCLLGLGLVTVLLGEPEEGGRHLETSLHIARKVGDETLAVWVLRMITHGLVEEGRLDEAETFAAEAIESATRLGARFEIGSALGTRGIVCRAQGDYEQAARLFNDEIEHHGATGDRWFRAAAVADTAEAEERRGNIARAETLARQGLDLAEDVETPAVAWNLDVLARALAGRGLVIEAARLWGAAEVLRERTGLTLPGYWIAGLEECIGLARARVGATRAFTDAWMEGRAMTATEAIATARATVAG